MFLLYFFFASCNSRTEQKLDKIQNKLDSIEKKMEIEHASTDALVNKDFISFVRLAGLHGVMNDLELLEDYDSTVTLSELKEDFISEVIDQNLMVKDTIITDTYKITFYNETDSSFILKAEGYPGRFNKYCLKFILWKTGELELGFWDQNEDGPKPIPDSVKEENGQLMITTDSFCFTIPQIQKLKFYERKVRSEDYEYHELNSCILLKFPKITVTMK